MVGTHADSGDDWSPLGEEVLQAVKKADSNQRQEIQAEIDMLRYCQQFSILQGGSFCFFCKEKMIFSTSLFKCVFKQTINLKSSFHFCLSVSLIDHLLILQEEVRC